jgi:hypothetical protein
MKRRWPSSSRAEGADASLGCRMRDCRRMGCLQRRAVDSAMSAFAAIRWRSMARYTVERPTPKNSATSRVLYSPLCTGEARCVSCVPVEFWLLAAESTLGLGELHALAWTQPDQVGLELSSHRQDVEQQPPDCVGGVVDRPFQTQTDLPGRELVGNRSGVGQGLGQAVQRGHRTAVRRADEAWHAGACRRGIPTPADTVIPGPARHCEFERRTVDRSRTEAQTGADRPLLEDKPSEMSCAYLDPSSPQFWASPWRQPTQ